MHNLANADEEVDSRHETVINMLQFLKGNGIKGQIVCIKHMETNRR